MEDSLLDQLSIQKLQFSAQRGDAAAQCGLAVYYESAGDHSTAATWYRYAAQQGYAQAQYNLGCLLLRGQGVKQDFIESKKWFSEAAQQGYVNAIFNLAYMNENGLGGKRDKARAYSLYQEAAEHGDPDAKKKLLEIESSSKRKNIFQKLGWK